MIHPMKSRCFAAACTSLLISPLLLAGPAGGLEAWIVGGGVVAAIGFWLQASAYAGEVSHG